MLKSVLIYHVNLMIEHNVSVLIQSYEEEVLNSMGFSKTQMPEKSFQVTRQSRVTWRDFSGMSDLEKPILILPIHWIDIPVKFKVPKICKTA